MVYNYYEPLAKPRSARMFAAMAAIVSAMVLSLGIFASAFAAGATGNYSLFGSATRQSDGVHLVSNSTTDPYSGVSFALDPGATVNDINSLGATFDKTTGNCEVGSPRYTVETAAGNVFVYVGDAPNFDNCSDGSTGNLLATSDLRVDTSQVGGSQYDTWAHAQELVGNQEVTGLDFVLDGGWKADQALTLTSANVNDTNYDFTFTVANNKNQCKDGGYLNVTDAQGGSFINQGQCVAYINHNDGNGADDTHAHGRN